MKLHVLFTVVFVAYFNGNVEAYEKNLEWPVDEPIDVVVGPSNALHCRVTTPLGRRIFEQFGPCRITLDRVTLDHDGPWYLALGQPNNILSRTELIWVTVLTPASRPKVITHVEVKQSEVPTVLLVCALPGQHQVRNCQFRDPTRYNLLANEGLTQGQYTAVKADIPYHENITSCGLQIRDPASSYDFGWWRCAIELTNNNVYYGFLHVDETRDLVTTTPQYRSDSEPTLTAYERYIWQEEGLVTMLCSIQTEISYCYYRAPNGTIYNVNPGINVDGVEYIGSGFDAGECGVKMRMKAEDSGAWTCNVGLPTPGAGELRVVIDVYTDPAFTVRQEVNNREVVLRGRTFRGNPIDYCRYVRSDGLAFTKDSAPSGYEVIMGEQWDYHNCVLRVQEPRDLDHQPWTVFARVSGHRMEISAISNATTPQNRLAAYVWVLGGLLSGCVCLLLILLFVNLKRRGFCSRNKQTNNIVSSNQHNASPPPYTQ